MRHLHERNPFTLQVDFKALTAVNKMPAGPVLERPCKINLKTSSNIVRKSDRRDMRHEPASSQNYMVNCCLNSIDSVPWQDERKVCSWRAAPEVAFVQT